MKVAPATVTFFIFTLTVLPPVMQLQLYKAEKNSDKLLTSSRQGNNDNYASC